MEFRIGDICNSRKYVCGLKFVCSSGCCPCRKQWRSKWKSRQSYQSQVLFLLLYMFLYVHGIVIINSLLQYKRNINARGQAN
jgi:hypothetical protein